MLKSGVQGADTPGLTANIILNVVCDSFCTTARDLGKPRWPWRLGREDTLYSRATTHAAQSAVGGEECARGDAGLRAAARDQAAAMTPPCARMFMMGDGEE